MVDGMDGRPTTAASHRRRGGARVGRILLTAGAALVCTLGVTGALDPSTHISSAAVGAETPQLGVLPGPLKASVAKAAATAVKGAVKAPAWTQGLPADTTQAVRTIRTHQFCSEIWCTRTEAWEKVDGVWRIATKAGGKKAVFRSQVGQNGFASASSRRQGDMRTPSGIYDIVTTFSTTKTSPTAMPWRRRLPTSGVSDEYGRFYNTWVESKGSGGGDRRMMSWGLWIDWNNPRLEAGQGPRPVPGRGSGIFMHTSNPGRPFVPTAGCVQLGDPDDMAWIVKWLTPDANPRIVNNR
jgi:L,D-peptidoglycan transpeptidase YkuD (ErfK/YbiS/YcfS/YnhG family)